MGCFTCRSTENSQEGHSVVLEYAGQCDGTSEDSHVGDFLKMEPAPLADDYMYWGGGGKGLRKIPGCLCQLLGKTKGR